MSIDEAIYFNIILIYFCPIDNNNDKNNGQIERFQSGFYPNHIYHSATHSVHLFVIQIFNEWVDRIRFNHQVDCFHHFHLIHSYATCSTYE